jgi:hypothetical protein
MSFLASKFKIEINTFGYGFGWHFFGGGTRLGFELRACALAKQVLTKLALYHLSHTSSPFYWLFWRPDRMKYLPRLALNCNPPELSLPSSWDYRCETPTPGLGETFLPSELCKYCSVIFVFQICLEEVWDQIDLWLASVLVPAVFLKFGNWINVLMSIILCQYSGIWCVCVFFFFSQVEYSVLPSFGDFFFPVFHTLISFLCPSFWRLKTANSYALWLLSLSYYLLIALISLSFPTTFTCSISCAFPIQRCFDF